MLVTVDLEVDEKFLRKALDLPDNDERSIEELIERECDWLKPSGIAVKGVKIKE